MITNYFYEAQLRKYLLQFTTIFSGLQVATGKNECGEVEMITVPVVIGHRDRVVAALASGNTSNRMFSLPTMAAHMVGITRDDSRRKAIGVIDQRVTLPQGGIFPDDLVTVKRVMPIPYEMQVELSIYASNTQQMHQILEQILVLFNPDLQIQKSDAAFDWTKITRVELSDISNEENYPAGADRRIIMWTLNFRIPIWISIPMGVKDDLVRRVIIQIGELDKINVNEVDENGNLIPFGDPIGRIDYDTRPIPDRAECVFDSVTAPDPDQVAIDDTWFKSDTQQIFRWTGQEWYLLEDNNSGLRS